MPANGAAGSAAAPDRPAIRLFRVNLSGAPRRGAGRGGNTGVFDSRNAAPGRRNDQSSPPPSTKNPRSRYCGHCSAVAPSLTPVAGIRIAWLSSTMSATVRSESHGWALAKNSARSGPPRMIASCCSPYSGIPSIAHASSQCCPVRQLIPSHPSAARTMPIIGRGPGVAGQTEASHSFGHQHRVRERRQQ